MLDQLYFGKDDAETDIGRSGLLATSFLETAAYKDAIDGNKWLILGRKGSGKSAISLMIMRAFEGKDCSSLVTPDEISAEEIKRFDLGGIAQYQAKELLWRYIFAVQIAKFLLKFDKANRVDIETQLISDKVRKFLIENGEADDLTVVERFWRTIEKLKFSLKISAFSAEASASVDMASGVRLSEQVEVIEAKLREFARELRIFENPNSFYLLVDQIERIWSNDPGSDALVIGLLRAGKFIQAYYPFVNCTVFLRIDIYEKLNFPERDKLRGDEFHIRWTREDLIALIEARASASSKGEFGRATLWARVFPRKIGEKDVKRYLSHRTLNRPRDIIQLCNACRDVARAKGRAAITQWDVLNASGQYSRWKLVDIQNEWMLNYPFLADALLLLSNGSYLFTKREFEKNFDALHADLKVRYPESNRQLSPDLILSILFFVGVLGVIRNNEPVFFCECDFDERLRVSDNDFVVHPCFREALQCTSAINLRSFEQSPNFAGEVARSARSRFARRSISPVEESMDASAYFMHDLIKMTRFIREQVGDVKMSSQIQEEIRTNLVSVEGELEGLLRSADEVELRDSVQRIGIFFRDMERGLLQRRIVSEKVDFIYGLRGAADMCREASSYGGGHRAFRSA